MTLAAQKLSLAEWMPDVLCLRKHYLTGDEFIAWNDDKEPVTDREWLQVMWEAEERLPKEKREDYYNILFALLPADENFGPVTDLEGKGPDLMLPSSFAQIHASENQRLEAWSRTIHPEAWE